MPNQERCAVCTHREYPLADEDGDRALRNSEPWHDAERGLCRTDTGTWGCACGGAFEPDPDAVEVARVRAALGAQIRRQTLSSLPQIADPEAESVCGYCRKAVKDAHDLVAHLRRHQTQAGF